MIPGIVAATVSTGGDSPGSTVLADLDFTTETYTVNGVSVDLADIFAASSVGVADAAARTSRGWLTHAGNTNRPKVAGDLAALLLEPCLVVVEWEDAEWYCDQLLAYSDGTAARAYASAASGFSLTYQTGPSSWNTQFSSGDPLVPFGVNRAAALLGGSATSRVALNADTTPDIDMSDLFTDWSISEVLPFGGVGDDPVGGWVRRLLVYPASHPQTVATLSTLTTPSPVSLSQAALTASTLQVAFSPAFGATGYEYQALVRAGATVYPGIATADDWQALPGDKIITGLTPSTGYSVWVRPVGASGPGGCLAALNITTPAA